MGKMCEVKEMLEDKVYDVVTHGLDEVNAKELGEVVDILKDIEMMKYYSSVVEAMDEKRDNPHADEPDYISRMYYSSTKNEATLDSIMEDITSVMDETPREHKLKIRQDLLNFINKIPI